jgi:hypothetical protein
LSCRVEQQLLGCDDDDQALFLLDISKSVCPWSRAAAAAAAVFMKRATIRRKKENELHTIPYHQIINHQSPGGLGHRLY